MMKKWLAAAALSAFSVGAMAAPAYVEGRDYTRIAPAQPVASAAKIEVREFFWYNCPHCYRLQAPLEAWLAKAPADIDYKATPAVLSPRWGILAKAYFAQEALGPVDRKLHMAIFKAIHESRQDLEKPEALFQVVDAVKGKEYGAKYRAAYGSFGVQTQLGKGGKLAQSYQLQGTPTVVVDGIYAVSPSTAGSEAAMIPIVNYLTQMQRAKKAAAKPVAAPAATPAAKSAAAQPAKATK